MRIAKRRRREGKTDYANRIKLLKGEKPRVVFRKTNKYIITQYITSSEALDKVGMGITSKQLIRYGWPKELEKSLKSIPASYLTGFLIGKKIIKNNLETPIVDLGMIRTLHKSKVYAFLKGIIDAGVKIKCEKDVFPSEDRLKGKHMKKEIDFDGIKSKIENEK